MKTEALFNFFVIKTINFFIGKVNGLPVSKINHGYTITCMLWKIFVSDVSQNVLKQRVRGIFTLHSCVTYQLAIETITASGASKILPPYGVKALRMKINLQRSHYNGKFTTDETRLL